MTSEQKTTILTFLASEKLMVIATTDLQKPSPESALVAFAEDTDLCLYFQTKNNTRKAANLSMNSGVSLVIGTTADRPATLQYEGVATQISDSAELANCKQRFIDKGSPSTQKYFDDPATIFFKISPTWIGFSDYSARPPAVFELNDFSI